MPHRPFGMPKAAITILIYLYLVLGSVPALDLMVLGPVLHSKHGLLNDHFMAYLVVIGGGLLALIFFVRGGSMAGLYLFRGVSWLLTAMLVVGLSASALLAGGMIGDASRHARLTGKFTFIALLICTPIQWLLLRGLTRVRWLDPRASPDEWEPPARRSGSSPL